MVLMRPSLFAWFALFFAFGMFILIAPLPLWFRIVALVAAVAAYWRYRWVTHVRERTREAIGQGQARYEERKRHERPSKGRDDD